jgi:hypothetical protein
MPPILRQRPGDKALARGKFDLTGRHGQSAHRSVECEKGDQLPVVEVGDDIGAPYWVLVDEITDDAAKAA